MDNAHWVLALEWGTSLHSGGRAGIKGADKSQALVRSTFRSLGSGLSAGLSGIASQTKIYIFHQNMGLYWKGHLTAVFDF